MVTSGVALTKRTVWRSITSTRSSEGHSRRATGGTSAGNSRELLVVITEVSDRVLPPAGWVLPNIRSALKLNATSSAVSSSPLWNFTPRRSDNSTVRSSIRRHSVARPGICSNWPW